MQRKTKLLRYQNWIWAFVLLITACAKEPGEGGTAAIFGTVETVEVRINQIQISPDTIIYDTTILNRYPSPEKEMFLIYGKDDVHDDDIRTDFEGQFQFRDLYKGKYQLFVYSECYDCAAGIEAVFHDVELTYRGQQLEIPPISVYKID